MPAREPRRLVAVDEDAQPEVVVLAGCQPLVETSTAVRTSRGTMVETYTKLILISAMRKSASCPRAVGSGGRTGPSRRFRECARSLHRERMHPYRRTRVARGHGARRCRVGQSRGGAGHRYPGMRLCSATALIPALRAAGQPPVGLVHEPDSWVVDIADDLGGRVVDPSFTTTTSSAASDWCSADSTVDVIVRDALNAGMTTDASGSCAGVDIVRSALAFHSNTGHAAVPRNRSDYASVEPMRPPVDVVVPFVGSEEALRSLCHALEELDLSDADSVTVVDNRPQGTETETAYGRVRVLRAPAIQSSYYARNCGARDGEAPWILFVDADVQVSGDLLARYFDEPPRDQTGVLAGAIGNEAVASSDGQTMVARYSALKELFAQQRTLTAVSWVTR